MVEVAHTTSKVISWLKFEKTLLLIDLLACRDIYYKLIYKITCEQFELENGLQNNILIIFGCRFTVYAHILAMKFNIFLKLL